MCTNVFNEDIYFVKKKNRKNHSNYQQRKYKCQPLLAPNLKEKIKALILDQSNEERLKMTNYGGIRYFNLTHIIRCLLEAYIFETLG